jgi:hypothetical protein
MELQQTMEQQGTGPQSVTAEGQQAVVRAGQAALALRAAGNLVTAAVLVQRVGRELAGATRAVAADRQLAAAKSRQLIEEAKRLVEQARATADPGEVAAGFAGLAAGEVMGGAVGGVVGALVGGPPGAILGAEVGAFTGGMLGMKLGTDAVHDFVGVQVVSTAPQSESNDGELSGSSDSRETAVGVGTIVGLTSGASVGRLVAGRAGGAVGAFVGQAIARQLEQVPTGAAPKADISATERLNRFGKRTAGEAATILVAGAIGSVFGSGGRAVGRRFGFVLGHQITWEQLSLPSLEGQTAVALSLPKEHSLTDDEPAPEHSMDIRTTQQEETA